MSWKAPTARDRTAAHEVLLRVEPATGRVFGPRGEVPLTDLELRFLRYLLERRGQVVSVETLLREVWGYHPSVQSKAVMLLVSRLRRKLGEDPAHPRFVLTVPGGYSAPAERDGPALVDRVERLHRALYQDVDALTGLDGLVGEIEVTLAADLSQEDRAKLELALGAWALERQPHRSAVPLWELAASDLPPHVQVSCAVAAAKLMSISGLRDPAAVALLPWLDRCPADLAGTRLRAELLMTLANQHRQLGESVVGEAHAREALELAEQIGDPILRGRAMGALGSIIEVSGARLANSMTLSADAVSILRAAGADVLAASYECNLGVRYYSLGRLVEAEACLVRGAAALRRFGRLLDAAMADSNLGVVRLAVRDPASALALAEQALATFELATDHNGECHARLVQGRALCALGRLEPAADALERCVALATRQRSLRLLANAQRCCVWLAAMRGDLSAGALAEASQEGLARLGQEPNPYLALWIAWITGERSPAAPGGLNWRLDEPGVSWIDGHLSRLLAARLGWADTG